MANNDNDEIDLSGYEPHSRFNDSEAEMWMDSDEEGTAWRDDEDLWQAASGHNVPLVDKERHLTPGRSINVFDFLRDREMGEQNSKARRTDTFLSFFLMSRWPKVSRREMLWDAKLLLQRKLYLWEGAVLTFVQNRNRHINLTEEFAKFRKDSLLQVEKNTEFVAPVTFVDIVDVFLRFGGTQLETRSDRAHDVLHHLCENRFINSEDMVDFFKDILQRGYDFQRKGGEIVKIICPRFEYRISNTMFRVLEMLLNGGLELAETTRRRVILQFTKNILTHANLDGQTTLELLLGCNRHNTNERAVAPAAAPAAAAGDQLNRFEWAVRMLDTLVVNGALNYESWDKNCVLFEILEEANRVPSPCTMLPVLRKCIARGLAIQTVDATGSNLLMRFCGYYKGADLVDVIRLLCSNGIDVNARPKYPSSKYRDTALLFLLDNAPFNREEIYDAARVLVELGTDITSNETFGPEVLERLWESKRHEQCCHFKRLRSMNESQHYWNTLDYFLDACIRFDLTRNRSCSSLLRQFLYQLSLQQSEREVCLDCLLKSDTASFPCNSFHFQKALEFFERLIQSRAPIFSDELNELNNLARSKFGGQLRNSLIDILSKFGVLLQPDSV